MTFEEYQKAKDETFKKVPIRQLINFEKEKQNIKVSIVIPIFNVETYLPQCLDSIINQSLEDIEIICVNDGSTDTSLEILEKYQSKDDRIKIINKDNAGYGHTMNIGMDMASGEYILIVESDDYILQDMIKTLYKTAKENDLDFVKSDYYRFFGEDDNIIKNYFKIDPTDSYYNKIISTHDSHEAYTVLMNTWTGLYKTSFLRKNNIRHFETPGASYQDNGFWFKTFYYGKRVMFIPEAFYMYRRDNPNSSVRNKQKVYAMDTEYELIYNFLDTKGETKKFMDAYTLAKYNNFHFTIDRIDLDFKKEFLLNTSKNFKEMITKNEFNPSLLEEKDLKILKWLIDDPENYYEYNYKINTDYYEYLSKYMKARIDIKNYGQKENDILILECDDTLCDITRPEWFKNQQGTGTILNSINGELNLKIRCIGDGNLVLDFRSLDYQDKAHTRLPIYIDYTEITIDDENIVTGSIVSWHDKPFTYKKQVKNNQIIKLQVKWKPLNNGSNLKTPVNDEKILQIFSKCRLDIKNMGTENNNVKIIENNDYSSEINQPGWFKDKNGIGTIIESSSGHMNITLECINDGRLELEFKSTDFRDNKSKRVPIFIDFTSIHINNKKITNRRIAWHDDPIKYKLNVKNRQKIKIQLNWQLINNTNSYLFEKDSEINIDEYSTQQLIKDINRLKTENNQLRKFNEKILNSNSWKLTESLRKIKNH